MGIWEFLHPGFEAVEIYLLQKLGGAFVPAFFIAGAIGSWVPRSVIVRYLSKGTSFYVSYPVSLIAGGLLSVCACGILPLFQTIWQRGAGVGPAITFLFSGPAINLIAILFTFQLLGTSLGFARIFAVIFLALLMGGIFHFLFKKAEDNSLKVTQNMRIVTSGRSSRGRIFVVIFLAFLVIVLPMEQWDSRIRWGSAFVFFILTLFSAWKFLEKEERTDWLEHSWTLMKGIVPKLFLGIFVVGILEPFARDWLVSFIGKGGFQESLLVSLIGAVLYLGTILGVVAARGLHQLGLSDGAVLAFMLSGPTVAIPTLIVVSSVAGKRIGMLYFFLVVLFSALVGYGYDVFM